LKKRIWIDIVNSPQVLFFKPIIDKLEKDNEVIVTARKHSQTTDLLDMYKIKYTVIGEHAGKSKIKKALTLFKRVKDMYKFAKERKFDCSVVHQSPYCMFPSWLLGIKKRIFIFDNETAVMQNMVSMPFCTHATCPEAISDKRIFFKKLIKYPGLKESVYIVKHKVKKENYVLMRPEPWSAAYYHGGEDVLVPIIEKLLNDWKIVLIPRDDKQRKFYSEKFGVKITIPTKMIPANELIGKSAIVIGAGGSMNREAVVLGVPVISTYKGKLLAVDRWLIKEGLMYHTSDIDSEFVKKCIKNHKKADFDSALDKLVELIE